MSTEPDITKQKCYQVCRRAVLGPLLFLVLIGDIDQNIATAFLSSFADDTRVRGKISCIHDTDLIQKDLNSVYDWTTENMELHGDKFELLRYGLDPDLKADTLYKSNTGLIIKEEEQVRDLGVTMHRSGSFSLQIQVHPWNPLLMQDSQP